MRTGCCSCPSVPFSPLSPPPSTHITHSPLPPDRSALTLFSLFRPMFSPVCAREQSTVQVARAERVVHVQQQAEQNRMADDGRRGRGCCRQSASQERRRHRSSRTACVRCEMFLSLVGPNLPCFLFCRNRKQADDGNNSSTTAAQSQWQENRGEHRGDVNDCARPAQESKTFSLSSSFSASLFAPANETLGPNFDPFSSSSALAFRSTPTSSLMGRSDIKRQQRE